MADKVEALRFDLSKAREAFDERTRAVKRLGTRAVDHARTVQVLSDVVAREMDYIRELRDVGDIKARGIDDVVRQAIEALRPELEGQSFNVSGKLYGWTEAEDTKHLNPNPVMVANTRATVTKVLNPQQRVDGGFMQYISHRLYWGSEDLPARELSFRKDFHDQPSARDLGAYFGPTTLYVDVDPVVILELNDDARRKVGLVVGEDLNHEYGYHADLVFARLQEVELTPLAAE